MTRSELDKMKETLKKGMLLDGISVDERIADIPENKVLSPIVITPTHIGWELLDKTLDGANT